MNDLVSVLLFMAVQTRAQVNAKSEKLDMCILNLERIVVACWLFKKRQDQVCEATQDSGRAVLEAKHRSQALVQDNFTNASHYPDPLPDSNSS